MEPLVAGVAILVGVVASLVIQLLVIPRHRVREISEQYPLPFSPAGFLGSYNQVNVVSDAENRVCGGECLPTSAYRIWFFIWATTAIASIYLVILGSLDAAQVGMRRYAHFAPGVLIACCWLCVAFWPIAFVQNRYWAFWLSAALLLLAALLGLIALGVLRPWSDASPVTAVLVGIGYSTFVGWLCVAATLSTCVAISFNSPSYGVADADSKQWFFGFVPLTVAGALSFFAFVFGDPVLPLPYLWALLFTPGIRTSWKVWGAAIVCVLGSVIGGLMILAWQGVAAAAAQASPPPPSEP